MFDFDFKAYEEKRKLEEQRQKENKICLKQAKEKIEKETGMTFIEWFNDFCNKNFMIFESIESAIDKYMIRNEIKYSSDKEEMLIDRILTDEEFLMEIMIETDMIYDKIYDYIYEMDEDFEFDLNDKGC